uniref:Secreted protein n=1 Tax=Coccidioides posadasii RMSCC 3488 TaxID=454284 RepID=A0A0J6F9Y8_COCPO|nr:hypothetical protein CPAG_06164 [Coccidioides posadasii RMSCC 3488]
MPLVTFVVFAFVALVQTLAVSSTGDVCQMPEDGDTCREMTGWDGIKGKATTPAKGESIRRYKHPDRGCDGNGFEVYGQRSTAITLTITGVDPRHRRNGRVDSSERWSQAEYSRRERHNSCSEPVRNTCTFYETCLEERVRCGPTGYPVACGQHYCQKFATVRGKFSDRGQVWLTDTMYCLQKKLVPYATGQKNESCSELKKYAYATHSICYVECGVCALPPSDWVATVDTTGFKELFGSVDALISMLETADGCKDFYLWLIKKTIR